MFNKIIALLAFGSAVLVNQAHAGFDFITVDGSTGDLTFTPETLAAPMLQNLVKVLAIGGGFLMAVYVWRLIKRHFGKSPA